MDSSSEVIIPDKHIIFFDGVCNLCNGAIEFIMKRDDDFHFVFESLQSSRAKNILGDIYSKSLETLVVRTTNGNTLTKSKAVFFISKKLKGPVRIISICSVLPTFLTDFFYSVIARYRYKLFGTRNTCRLPNPDDKLRFLEGYQNV